MIKQSVFVDDANAHHSVWLVSVSPTDQYGRDAIDICNLSGCELLVRCPTHLLVTYLILWWQMSWHSRCVCWYSTGNFWSLLCQLCVSGWATCTGVQYQKYCPSKALYQLVQCPLHNQELYLKHHFEVSWSIRCVSLSYWWGHWQACSYKVLLFVVNLVMSNGLMPAARELMMSSRQLIMPGVDHAVQILGSICACSCWHPEDLWCCKEVT